MRKGFESQLDEDLIRFDWFEQLASFEVFMGFENNIFRSRIKGQPNLVLVAWEKFESRRSCLRLIEREFSLPVEPKT